jgi:ribosomal protein L14
VYFVVDNTYAKQLIRELVGLLKEYSLIGDSVYVVVSNTVNVCNEKMGRFVKGAVGDYNLIVVLVDS